MTFVSNCITLVFSVEAEECKFVDATYNAAKLRWDK
jgi:hypothetical protein